MNKYKRALRKLKEDQTSWDDLDELTFEEEQEKFGPRTRVKSKGLGEFDELFERTMRESALRSKCVCGSRLNESEGEDVDEDFDTYPYPEIDPDTGYNEFLLDDFYADNPEFAPDIDKNKDLQDKSDVPRRYPEINPKTGYNKYLLDDFYADLAPQKSYNPFEEFGEPGQEVPWGRDPGKPRKAI